MLRGRELKRYVRAAAALHELYDDTAIGEAVGRTRITVGKWWKGAQPEPPTLRLLAMATGLSPDELTNYVYFDGPPPTLVEPGSPTEQGAREGIQRDRDAQPGAGLPGPSVPPARPPRGTRQALV